MIWSFQMNSEMQIVYILFNQEDKPFFVSSGKLKNAECNRQERKAKYFQIICQTESKELISILEAATLLWMQKHYSQFVENKNQSHHKLFKLLPSDPKLTFSANDVTEEWKEKVKQGTEAAKARGVKFGRKKKSQNF
jgi:hypothetical protein